MVHGFGNDTEDVLLVQGCVVLREDTEIRFVESVEVKTLFVHG